MAVCKPPSECDPLPKYTFPLKPGMVIVNDTSGCCATSNLICNKLKCPPKPKNCSEAFYEITTIEDAGSKDEQCCDLYKCVPPKNKCIVTIDGKKYLKAIGEKWPTSNPCLTKECTVDVNSNPIEKEIRQTCTEKCELGFELEIPKGQCCGKCVQTKCVLDGVTYNPGQTWPEPGNNCTQYSCVKVNNLYLISKSEETCPSIESCPENERYKKGCCYFCKPTPRDLTIDSGKCEPKPRVTAATVGLIKQTKVGHGPCVNKEQISNFTECKGGCNSGTRWNTKLNIQEKFCTCCQMKTEKEINIQLTCDDGFKFTKPVSVPTSCSCNPCSSEVPQTNAPYTAATGVKTKPVASPYIKG